MFDEKHVKLEGSAFLNGKRSIKVRRCSLGNQCYGATLGSEQVRPRSVSINRISPNHADEAFSIMEPTLLGGGAALALYENNPSNLQKCHMFSHNLISPKI